MQYLNSQQIRKPQTEMLQPLLFYITTLDTTQLSIFTDVVALTLKYHLPDTLTFPFSLNTDEDLTWTTDSGIIFSLCLLIIQCKWNKPLTSIWREKHANLPPTYFSLLKALWNKSEMASDTWEAELIALGDIQGTIRSTTPGCG